MTFGSTFGRTFSPTFQPKSQAAASSASTWWDLNGTLTSCVAAYQPKGAASLAASKINLANPGTYDLTDGNPPAWSVDDGWTFDGVDDHLYESTYEPYDTDFTVVARVNNLLINHNSSSILFGTKKYNASGWAIKIEQYNNTGKVGFSSWASTPADLSTSISSPVGVDTIIAFTRDGNAVKAYVGNNTQDLERTISFSSVYKGLVISAYMIPHYSASTIKGNIYAIAYYHAALTSTHISDLTTAMNAL